jgi:hypothetical protein
MIIEFEFLPRVPFDAQLFESESLVWFAEWREGKPGYADDLAMTMVLWQPRYRERPN